MRVYIDTAPIIYLTEGSEDRQVTIYTQIQNWIRSDAFLGTSSLTLLEVLVGPKRSGNKKLANKYKVLLRDILSCPLIPIDDTIAEKAAEYRAEYGFKTPDSIQLATAIEHGYDVFFTNDKQLKQCEGIDILLCPT